MCSTFKDFMRIQDTKNQFPFKQTTQKKNWSLRQSNYVYQTKSIIQENEEKKPPKKYLHSQMGEKKTTYAFNYKKKNTLSNSWHHAHINIEVKSKVYA